MKKILIASAILIVIAALVVFLIVSKGGKTDQTLQPGTTFPVASSTTGTGQGALAAIPVATAGGQLMTVNDFIHDGTTVADSQNPGRYYLAGSLGYCLEDGTCPAGAPSSTYTIAYDEQSRSFIVTLDAEPIGQARLKAEEYLLSALGLSKAQACQLAVQVLTTIDVNETYAGENLGLSFCPGAVALPR